MYWYDYFALGIVVCLWIGYCVNASKFYWGCWKGATDVKRHFEVIGATIVTLSALSFLSLITIYAINH